MVQDLASLLWRVNLGCIDLNPWYARCDDVDRPDYLHFELDPGEGAGFDRVLETVVRRPRGRVLVDYNQIAWGRTLASIYSVRPYRIAGVSTPVSWQEVEHGFEIDEFTLRNVPGRAPPAATSGRLCSACAAASR